MQNRRNVPHVAIGAPSLTQLAFQACAPEEQECVDFVRSLIRYVRRRPQLRQMLYNDTSTPGSLYSRLLSERGVPPPNGPPPLDIRPSRYPPVLVVPPAPVPAPPRVYYFNRAPPGEGATPSQRATPARRRARAEPRREPRPAGASATRERPRAPGGGPLRRGRRTRPDALVSREVARSQTANAPSHPSASSPRRDT